MNRLKCDSCKRIVSMEGNNISCSACGHGKLKLMIPHNCCYKCHEPVYMNVDPDRRVLCWKCTADLTGKTRDGRDLYKARILRGMSQNALAVNLGYSREFITMMESGRKCLTNKAVTFIVEAEKPKKQQVSLAIGQEGQKGYSEVTDSKQLPATKNGGHGQFKSESVNSQQQSACLGLA